MGGTKTYQNGETSSNPDITATIVPKSEMLDFDLPSDVMYSRKCGDSVASSSGSNLRSYFIGMGFIPSLVDKVLEENGEDNVDLLLEILLECADHKKSDPQFSNSVDNLFGNKDECNRHSSTFVQPKEEPDAFGVDDEKRTSLLNMNFSAEEVDFAIEKLGIDAPVDEMVDFIIAAQVAAKFDEETDDELELDAEKSEDISNETLFGTMEKTLQLLEMGFSESEISLAVDRFSSEVPVLELANSICAEQIGEKYIVKDQCSSRVSQMNTSHGARDTGPLNIGMENEQKLRSNGNRLNTEEFGQEAIPRMSNSYMDEIGRGKRPKEEDIEDSTQFGHISFEKKDKGKRLRPEITPDLGSYFEPTWMEEKVDIETTGFRIPRAPSCKSVDRMVAKPPYFFYGNVATVSFDTWGKISQFLYGIKPEFVKTQFFCALSRNEGYVHNLPSENRFHIQPRPPMSIEDAMPHAKKWWPSWDTRKQLSHIIYETNGVSQLCDRLGRLLTDSQGLLSSERKREILHLCQKFNLIWIGPHKLSPIDPEYLELILGYPFNHTQASGYTLLERLHSLRYGFQVDTLGYHLSVLKSVFPEGITMLSLFTGIGGAEVALHRLGIHMKGVVSVETCDTKRKILKSWWHSSGQTGELEQIEDIQKLTSGKIDRLIEKFGGFDFIICQNPCTQSSRSSKISPESGAPSTLDFSLFCEFVRVLQRVRNLMERKR